MTDHQRKELITLTRTLREDIRASQVTQDLLREAAAEAVCQDEVRKHLRMIIYRVTQAIDEADDLLTLLDPPEAGDS